MPFSDADLARIRAHNQSFMTTPVTITRTGHVTVCRITPGLMRARPDGWADFTHLTRYTVTLPDGEDIRLGDQFVATGVGTFYVIQDRKNQTVSYNAGLYAARVDDAIATPFGAPTATVTFRQKGTDEALTGTSVLLEPAAIEQVALLRNAGLEVTHSVAWDDTLAFPDGQPILAGDSIEFVAAPGQAAKSCVLLKPRRWTLPAPVAQAHFKDVT